MQPVGYIYALYDLQTGVVRYVGKTAISLAYRLERHLWASRSKGRVGQLHVSCWIRSVNSKVGIRCLETVDTNEINSAERKWIASFSNLTNIRHGGEGGGRFSLTPEQRAKISAANRRRFQDPAARERIAQSNRTRILVPGRTVKHTAEGRRKMSQVNKRPKTDAEKLAMSLAHKKRLQNPYFRQILIDRLNKRTA